MLDNSTDRPDLSRLLEMQRAAFETERNPARAVRDDRLFRLGHLVQEREAEFIAAIDADFGHRPRQQTQMAEIVTVRGAVRYARYYLKSWMKPERIPTGPHFWPARTRLIRQPLGVVGIVAPWNYPLALSLGPAVAAIAAGNRVMIKPSEMTPRFSALLADAIAAKFKPDEIAVVLGNADIGRAFTSLPFDHILFTGSTAVGREVAVAAARNLVPVTLELGGKSPAIIDPSAELAVTARRIVNAKLFNAGQTCIAPDYLIVRREAEASVIAELVAAAQAMYPAGAASPDLTSIVSDRHHARLRELLRDAESKGAEVVEAHPASCGTNDRRMGLKIVRKVTGDMRLMQEEIFGPLLPILAVDSASDAIGYVNANPRPLALYWFGEDAAARDNVLAETISGGVTVNDCMWHYAQEGAPFGGVGESGMGAYHGVHGFRTFSHARTIFYQSRWSLTRLFDPPYGRRFDRLMRIVRRL